MTAQVSPTQERKILMEYVTGSGTVPNNFAPVLNRTANDLFNDLFTSVLKQKPAFKCFKAGCIQETVVADWETVERLDQAILSPGSALLNLPGTVHRGAPIRLPDGGLSITWTILLAEKDYPLLVAALKASPGASKVKAQ